MPNDLESLQTHTPIKAQQSLTQATHTHTTIPKMIENPQTHHLIFTQKTRIIIGPQKMIVTHICTHPKIALKSGLQFTNLYLKFVTSTHVFSAILTCVCVTSSV